MHYYTQKNAYSLTSITQTLVRTERKNTTAAPHQFPRVHPSHRPPSPQWDHCPDCSENHLLAPLTVPPARPGPLNNVIWGSLFLDFKYMKLYYGYVASFFSLLFFFWLLITSRFFYCGVNCRPMWWSSVGSDVWLGGFMCSAGRGAQGCQSPALCRCLLEEKMLRCLTSLCWVAVPFRRPPALPRAVKIALSIRCWSRGHSNSRRRVGSV